MSRLLKNRKKLVIGVGVSLALIIGATSTAAIINKEAMVREEVTEITINASQDKVWETFANFEEYSEWNPFIKRVSGSMVKGEKLEITLQNPGGRKFDFSPTLLETEPGQEFRWVGKVLVPGLFDGEHYFKIEPLEDDKVRFIQGEIFTGVLVPFMGGLIDSAKIGFEEMNVALKERAETT